MKCLIVARNARISIGENLYFCYYNITTIRQFSHRFKCTARTSQPKKQLSDYEIVKKRSSYDELYHTTPQEVILGKGALGLVKLVKDLLTNRLYALKTVHIYFFFLKKIFQDFKETPISTPFGGKFETGDTDSETIESSSYLEALSIF